MNTINFASEVGEDLSGRGTAVDCRKRILKESAAVCLNFHGVRTVSDSFADELFGVLAVEKGEGWFRENLKVEGLSADVRLTILSAIQSRIERQQEDRQPVCQ